MARRLARELLGDECPPAIPKRVPLGDAAVTRGKVSAELLGELGSRDALWMPRPRGTQDAGQQPR